MDATQIELDLNGEWQLVLDPDDVGKRRNWFEIEQVPEAVTVQVPSVWDRWVPDYDGVGWYFREFHLGDEWRDRHVTVEFEAADYYAEVWLNGARLGDHEGGYTPFSLNATRAVRIGSNRLAVRIIDPHGPDGFGEFLPRQIPCAKEHGYFSFAGLWGAVRLVGKSPTHITDLFVQPDIRRKRITVYVATSLPGTVRLLIEGTSLETTGAPGALILDFPDYEPWSTDTPKLYTLRCELCDGHGVADCARVRFGMREFTVKENRFCLNNRPIFIKGILHQPDYARSLAAPETVELARRELQAAKDAGFNLIRLHIKTAPKLTLELADEIGLMLYEEPPIGWIEKSERMKERCEREVREMILRDRNHPSVVMWGMLNESGNADYVVNGGAQLIKDDLCRLARSLDPTRVIIDDSGGVNSTREPARLMRSYRHELEPYDDLHIYQRAPVDREIELYFQHSGDPGKLYFLSEFGFGGMENLPDVVDQYGDEKHTLKDARFLGAVLETAERGFVARDLDRVFGGFAGLTAAAQQVQRDAVRYQVDAIRLNPKNAGYCYTQLCDAGHEFCAGILDRWRRPKPAVDMFKEVQKPLRPVIHVAQTNLIPRQEVTLTVTLLNEERIEGLADLSLQVVGPTNQVLWKKRRNVKIPKHGKELWSGTVSASGSPGTHRFVVRLMQGMKLLGQNDLELHVFEPVEACDVQAHILDPQGQWQRRCAALAKPAAMRAPIHVVPPLANTVRAYPDNDLAQVLAQAKGGAVALIFGPPDDWNDFVDQVDPVLHASSKDAVGAFLGIYHYVKLHPVFDRLPARGLMRQPYRNTVPPKTFLETSEEDICGAFDASPIAAGNYMMDETVWWGSDILVRRYGSGRVVFTHLRILENLGQDPVADRLFVNMLNHFSRRSVPSEGLMPLHQKSVEWLRTERVQHVRRWMVIGMFSNWGDQGHDAVYPPEQEIDFSATYRGWYKPVTWRPWFSRAQDNHLIDLQKAFTPVYEYYPRFDHGTGYAYAEFSCEKRQTVRVKLGVQDATKVWLNGAMIFETRIHLPHRTLEHHSVDAMVKQGRNTLLVKVSKMPGEFRFAIDFGSATPSGEPVGSEPLALTWWK